jgi:hypothetical protein
MRVRAGGDEGRKYGNVARKAISNFKQTWKTVITVAPEGQPQTSPGQAQRCPGIESGKTRPGRAEQTCPPIVLPLRGEEARGEVWQRCQLHKRLKTVITAAAPQKRGR